MSRSRSWTFSGRRLVLVVPLVALAGVPLAGTHQASGAPPRVVAAAQDARLVPNASFEESASQAARWSPTGLAGAVSVVSSPVHSGQIAARIDDTSGTEAAGLRSGRLAATPGEQLTASVWADRVSGAGGHLYLEFWRADGTRSTAQETPVPAASGWQQVAVSGVAPYDAVTATVLADSTQADVGATVWDDVTVASVAPPSLRVPDGDFEEPRENPRPTEWTVADPGGSASVVTSPVHAGHRAVRMVDGATGAEVSVLSRKVPVTAGETVAASAWAQRVSGTTGQLYLEFRDSSGARIEPPVIAAVAAKDGWQAVTASGVAPSDAVTMTVRLYSTQAGTGTTVWDDVVLRSNRDPGYDATLGTGTVLFVGDQRVESYTNLTRTMRPGTKTGDPDLADVGDGVVLNGGTWDKNPRLSGTVLPAPDGGGYRMWYTAADTNCQYCTGYAESTDGLHWQKYGSGSVFGYGPGGVVENPAYGPGQPRYFMLHSGNDHYYYAARSDDGVSWTELNSGKKVIDGWDVDNVTYDPATSQFVAMTKQYPVDYAPTTNPVGPRTAWVSTSKDFVHWSLPRPSFAADPRDTEAITAPGTGGGTPWAEVYGMPAVRYGEQYLGLPWIFEITNSPTPLQSPGADKGRQRVELAASQDLLNWSRPDRESLIPPGPSGSWDWGWDQTGTTMLTVGDETWLYYGAFAGQHSCSADDVKAGLCSVPFTPSRIGLITWPKDRFESFHAGAGGGDVVTRPLSPQGTKLMVNAAPGSGELRVEVLDANGNPVPGYGAADATPVTGDAPAAAVRWGAKDTLPAGPLRLRFDLTAGDLYSYAIS